MPTYKVTLNGLLVEVYISKSGDWGQDSVLIWDVFSDVSDNEKEIIMQYLFDEGFISDRRTKCQISEV
tara:strand:- start:131 stop:334 length:204 start_codon:yes stop_codon:yes gene_type:complete